MTAQLRLIPPCILLLSVTACAPTVYTLLPDQEEYFKNLHTIALASPGFQMSPNTATKEEEAQFNARLEVVRKQFESLMTAKLSEAGFSVVPSDEYRKIWEQLVKAHGGVFDPVTGKKDDARYEAIQKKAAQEISARLPINAVLYLSIVHVTVHFASGVAKWDGTDQHIDGSLTRVEGVSGFFKTFFGSGANTSGNLPAISLKVRITDVQTGDDKFNHRGGIQLVMKRGAWYSTNLVPIQTEELFASEERNSGAVTYALDPIMRRPR